MICRLWVATLLFSWSWLTGRKSTDWQIILGDKIYFQFILKHWFDAFFNISKLAILASRESSWRVFLGDKYLCRTDSESESESGPENISLWLRFPILKASVLWCYISSQQRVSIVQCNIEDLMKSMITVQINCQPKGTLIQRFIFKLWDSETWIYHVATLWNLTKSFKEENEEDEKSKCLIKV